MGLQDVLLRGHVELGGIWLSLGSVTVGQGR